MSPPSLVCEMNVIVQVLEYLEYHANHRVNHLFGSHQEKRVSLGTIRLA